MTDVFESAFGMPMTRRLLIKRVAVVGAATWGAGMLPALARASGGGDFGHFNAIAPSSDDMLQVPDGYAVDVVIKWGDEFAPGLRFGYNCDYSTFFPMNGSHDEGLIWVNHEYVVPFFTTDWPNTPAQNALWNPRVEPYRTLMANEKSEVGGSIVHIRRTQEGSWEVVYGSKYSRRFTAEEPAIGYDGPVTLDPTLLPSRVARSPVRWPTAPERRPLGELC